MNSTLTIKNINTIIRFVYDPNVVEMDAYKHLTFGAIVYQYIDCPISKIPLGNAADLISLINEIKKNIYYSLLCERSRLTVQKSCLTLIIKKFRVHHPDWIEIEEEIKKYI